MTTVDGRTKLTVLATVDIRPMTLASLSHWASASHYSTICMRHRVARVHLRQLTCAVDRVAFCQLEINELVLVIPSIRFTFKPPPKKKIEEAYFTNSATGRQRSTSVHSVGDLRSRRQSSVTSCAVVRVDLLRAVRSPYYTVSQKNKTPNSCPELHQILTDFQNFSSDGLGSKFTTNWCLNIPPCLKHVATLLCEIWTSEKWSQSEICIVIHDKSQGGIAKQLKNDELLYYTFITQSAGERIFKIGEHLVKLQPTGKKVIGSCAPFALHFCPQR